MTFDEALEEIKTESEENRVIIEEAERMVTLKDCIGCKYEKVMEESNYMCVWCPKVRKVSRKRT